jgi:flagellin
LQRLRELSIQSSNATNSSSDRTALNSEAQQLISEIDRVAANSQFNGVKLLDGSFASQTFQIGANNTSNDRITVSSIASARTSSMGVSFAASVTGSAVNNVAFNGSNATINGVNIVASTSDGVSTANADASAKAKATAINASGVAGVTATAVTNVAGAAQTAVAGTGTITINGVATATITQTGTAATDRTATVNAINAISAATGVQATDTGADGTGITLLAADGRNVAHSFTQLTGTFTSGSTGVAAAATTFGTLSFSSSGSGGLAFGGTVATMGTPTNTAATATGTAISQLNISTVAGAQTALASIDSALSSVNSSRASLGAVQNRFTSVVSSLQTTSENLTASRSRIQDTDFAEETANLTRAQILQQAGTAMLAQANSLPQGVLSLLRG